MSRLRVALALVLVNPIAVAGCRGSAPPPAVPVPPAQTSVANAAGPGATASAAVPGDEPAARAFVNALLDAIQRDDLDAWRQLLASDRRSKEEGVLRMQRDAWRAAVLPQAAQLRAAAATVDRSGTRWRVVIAKPDGGTESLATVVEENGVLRLAEN